MPRLIKARTLAQLVRVHDGLPTLIYGSGVERQTRKHTSGYDMWPASSAGEPIEDGDLILGNRSGRTPPRTVAEHRDRNRMAGARRPRDRRACHDWEHYDLRMHPQTGTNFVISYNRGMKNVTVSLPEGTALWLRIRAAEANRSVSSWLAEMIEGARRREDDYEIAMESALARKPRKLEWVNGRKPTRDELHDRSDIR